MIDYLDGGGAERFVIALAERLDPERFEVALCATRETGRRQADQLAEAGITTLLLHRSARTNLGEWRPLWHCLRRERVDVLHAHLHGSNLWASVIGRAAGVPVVIATEHTWSFEGQRLRKALDRHVVGSLSSAFVAVSELDRQRMIDIVGVSARKTHVIQTGLIPHGESGGDGSSLRAELGLDASTPLIGTAAWLRPQKALEVLIAAFGRAASRLPDAHLVIAGDGDERARLEKEASDLGLGHRVHILGVRRDVPEVVRALDVVAMSSDFEGSPLFLLEAMSEGKAIVSTRVGGIPDMVRDGESALLVPPRDPGALADALVRAVGDPELRLRLGVAAARRVREGFAFEEIVRRWEALYGELVGAGNGAGAEPSE